MKKSILIGLAGLLSCLNAQAQEPSVIESGQESNIPLSEGEPCQERGIGDPSVQSVDIARKCEDKPIEKDPSQLKIFTCAIDGPRTAFLNEATTVNFHNSATDVTEQASVLDNTKTYIYNGQYYRLNGETIASNNRFSSTKGVDVTFTAEGKQTLYLFHKIYVRTNGQPDYHYTTNDCYREVQVYRKTPPFVTLVTPSSSSNTIPVGQSQTVTFSVSDDANDVTSFEIRRGNSLVKSCSNSSECSFSFTPTASQIGTVTYTAKAIDELNVSKEASVEFNIVEANIRPTATITVTAENKTGTSATVNKNEQVRLTAVFEDVNDDSRNQLSEGYLCEAGNSSSCHTFKLSQCYKTPERNRFTCSTTREITKSVEFTAQAKDKAGLHSSLASVSVKLNVDPNIALSISNNKTYAFIDEPYDITLTATDPDNSGFNSAVICLFSGPSSNVSKEEKSCVSQSVLHTVCNTNNSAINCNSQIPAPTRDGQYTYFAYVEDKDGGKSITSKDVYIRPIYGIRLANIGSGVEPNADVNFDIKIGGFSSQAHALTDLKLFANGSIAQAYSFVYRNIKYTVSSDGKIRNSAGSVTSIQLPTEHTGIVTLNAKWPARISGDVTLQLTGTTSTGKVSTSGTFTTSVEYPKLIAPSAVTVKPLGNGKYSATVAATANATQYKWQFYIANNENSLIEKANYEQPAVNSLQNFQTQYGDNGRQAKVCVSAVNVYQGQRQETAPTCTTFTVSNTQPLPNKPLFSKGFKHQFSGPYSVNWQLNGNEYTAQYKLYGWQGSIADKPANPTLLKTSANTDGEYIVSTPLAGDYTYQIYSCNTQNVCVEGAYQTVNHMRAIISSVSHVVSTAKKGDSTDAFAQKPQAKTSATCSEHCFRIKGAGINDSYGRIDMRVKLNAKTYRVNTSSATRIDAFTIEVKADKNVVEGFYEGGLTLQAINGISDAPKTLFHVHADAPNSHLDPINNPIVESISGRAYTTQDNAVLALTKQNIEVWTFDADGVATIPSVLSKSYTATNGTKQWQDEVYFGTTGHSFYKLNHEGHRVWQASTRGAITARAQVNSAGELYVGSHDKALYSFDPETGAVLWSYSFLYPVTEQVRLVGNDIHVTVQADKSNPSDLGETILYIVDRNAIDANALRFDDINGTATNPLRDLLNGDNAGWQPSAQHPQLQSLARLYYVLFKRLPSRAELSFMTFAYSQGVSVAEIITALLTSEEMKLALPGSMTNAGFVADMISRMFPSGAPTPIAGKTQSQWVAFLDEGGKRAALIEAWLNTAQANASHAQLAQRAIYYYYGHCTVDTSCDQNKVVDSDYDNLSDYIETLIGSDPLNPDDGINSPQLAMPTNDGFGTFVLEASEYDTSLNYQLVEHTVENNHEQILEFNFQQQTFTREPGQYSYKLQACKRVDTGSEQVESCAPFSNQLNVEVKSLVPDDAQFVDAIAPTIDGVGTIDGTAGVNGGAAAYSIPIELTPGRAPMQPSVSLNYSSNTGKGIAGRGWSISAGSSISRCASTFAQDGVSHSPDYSDKDKLCLNGQRLIKVGSGIYGASGTEYRTEIESFSKVTLHGDMNSPGSYFEVQHKNGNVSYFGRTDNSLDIRKPKSIPYSWLVEYSHDATANNFIHYVYKTYGHNEKLLDVIYYTGNSVSQYGMHSVKFDYENALDSNRRYHSGAALDDTQRLKSITTRYDYTRVRKYSLSYQESSASGQELLQSVTLCYGTGGQHCLPATTFNWQDNAVTVGGTHLNIETGFSISSVLPSGDRNGDGAKDWPGYYLNAEGGVTENSHPMAECTASGTQGVKANCHADNADINLDGLSDDIDLKPSGAQRQLVTYVNKKDGTSTEYTSDIYVPTLSSILHTGDMNGDSLPDIIIYESSASAYPDPVKFYYHTGDQNAPYSNASSQELFLVHKDERNTPTSSFHIGGDFDGNGIIDIYKATTNFSDYGLGKLSTIYLMRHEGKELNWKSKTIQFDDESQYSQSATGGWSRFYRFADLNGDGLQDWLGWHNPKDNGEKLYVRYSLGNGDFTLPEYTGRSIAKRTFWFVHFTGNGGTNETRSKAGYIAKYGNAIKVADIDSDGKDELLIPSSVAVTACSTVKHFKGPTEVCGQDLYETRILKDYSTTMSIDGSYDHSIYNYSALELKNGSFVSRPTDFIGSLHQSSMIDAQGDGLVDLVFNYGCAGTYCRFIDPAPAGYVEGKVNISRNYGTGTGVDGGAYRPVDLLHSVTNGLSLTSEWSYRPLSSAKPSGISGVTKMYKADADYEYGYQNFTSSMYAVHEFKQDNGVGSDLIKRYAYRGAVYNNQGRGFMGFRSIIEANMALGLVTQSDFSQVFPAIGKLKNTATFLISDYTNDGSKLSTIEPKALSQSSLLWPDNQKHSIPGVYSFYNSVSETIKRDLNYSFLSKATKSVIDIDEYGNEILVEEKQESSHGKYKKSTAKVYENDASVWWVNKLISQTVTNDAITNRSNNDALQQYNGNESNLDTTTWVKTEFKDFNSGRKAQKVLVTGSSGIGNETSFLFNSYGLPTQVTKKAQVFNDGVKTEQSRVATFTYTKDGSSIAEDGYYLLETSNAKHFTTKTITDPATGLKKSQSQQIGTNNYVTSVYGYDDFLRPYSQKTDGSPVVYTATQLPDGNKPEYAVMQVRTVSAGAPGQVAYVDKHGRTVRAAVENYDGSWIFSDKTFDEKGFVLFESQPYKQNTTPYGAHHSEYDALGRVGKIVKDQHCSTFHTGTLTTLYGYSGFTTTLDVSESCFDITLDQMSRTNNSLGYVVETKDAAGSITRFAYNSQGNPIVVRDAKGTSIVAKYDALGNKVRVVDPNQGASDFVYNGFGELQRESRGNSVDIGLNIDVLGRVIKRTATDESDIIYTFDSKVYGQLSAMTGNGVTHSYDYDALGRPITQTVSGDDHSFTTTTYYDANYGRVKGIKYPNNLTLEYGYDARGYQNTVINKADGYVYQNITERDVFGHIQAKTLGNGVTSKTYYSAQTAQMTGHYTTKDNTELLAIEYNRYDGFGNIKEVSVSSGEAGAKNSFDETYLYDNLHRLQSNQIQSANALPGKTFTTITYDYDEIGNILKKSDYASDYDYTNRVSGHTGGGANAVKRVNKNGVWIGFSYDYRGNMIKGDGLTSATYNAMDKPIRMTKSGLTVAFTYGPDHMRYKQVLGNKVTYYAGKHYEIDVVNGKTTTRTYIGDFAVISTESGKQPYLRYLHKDRLDSARLLTDANGKVVTERNFDPFGKPRSPSGGLKAIAKLEDLDEAKTRRGFTDHEHLDELELIHMNGRVYDYNLGRFMSVDPVIQAPMNSQSINPYSYIMNNPLAGTDPTGYSGQAKGSNCDNWNSLSCRPGAGNVIVTYDASWGKKSNGAKKEVKSGTAEEIDQITAQVEKDGGKLLFAHNGLDGTVTAVYEKGKPSLGARFKSFMKKMATSMATADGTRIGMQINQSNLDFLNQRITKEEHLANMEAIGTGAVLGIVFIIPGPEDLVMASTLAAVSTKAAFKWIRVAVFGKTATKSVDPNAIRFSQSSVNGAGDLTKSMQANGWKGDPIDVVRMDDGGLTTIDNTRVLAASRAGVNVQANIRNASDALPANMVERFTTKKGVPTTWGEAVQLRIGKQNSGFRNTYPNGSPYIGSVD
ncbi:RHS repeat-associated core domain-containing protein [Pseudoalteromonas luteoviolacea]|uniref:RHS repeat-associated core domain-containing protein n=1 Tax=Pseudoalteromonas luteoviolacea TaxID=43657 RepID=UPI001150EBF8|nr:RHS repeat-associated core domain-containing protein [Pseudoalteromonas luteoviolacea]TQF67815.1 PQQ-binding-like beta-propeller repeat protein [Pseudoalteromonas luteoviolacea]